MRRHPTRLHRTNGVVLNGRWKVVGIRIIVVEAMEIPLDDALTAATVVITKDKCIIESKKEPMDETKKERMEFTIKVASDKAPKQLDLIPVASTGEKVPVKCIFTLEKDTATVYFHVAVTRIPTISVSPDAPR